MAESYVAALRFKDKDTDKVYNPGDAYHSDSTERIEFLMDEGYIKEGRSAKEYPYHTGGGYYELSNGEKVRGKDEAAAAEEELHSEDSGE